MASRNPTPYFLSESAATDESARVKCLGMTFESDEARRQYFRAQLRERLPELRQRPDFPVAADEDILRLSDPLHTLPVPIRSSSSSSSVTAGRTIRMDMRAVGGVG